MPSIAQRREHEQDTVAEMVEGHLEHHEPETQLQFRNPRLTCPYTWDTPHSRAHECNESRGHTSQGTEHECWCGASVGI